ncbi:MAG: HD domain-containing protein [Lachnospiraceae bacterium]|nr:HD domain-containing protein [Lachnospiraceae bacterium]
MRANIYNTNFEAAVFILLTILYIYLRVRYYNRSAINVALGRLVIAEQLTVFLDLLTSVTITYADVVPLWVNMLLNSLYYGAIGLSSCMVAMFVMAFAKDSFSYKVVVTGAKAILFLYYVLLVVNLFTGLLFDFSNGEYVHGSLYVIVYVFPAFFVVGSAVLVLLFRQLMTKVQRVTMMLIILFSMLGPILQLLAFPDILLSNVTPAMSLLLALFLVVSPNYQKLVIKRAQLEKARKDLSKEVMERTKEEREKELREEKLSLQIIEALAATIDSGAESKQNHTENVARLSAVIAKEMKYKNPQEIYCMGMLHDIGIIGIDEDVLLKKGIYSREDREEMQRHCAIGADILSAIKELPNIEVGARWHHERYDGKGYPDGLSGNDIPLEARIICVADAFDAMTQQRSYKERMTVEEALSEMKKESGKQFDPKVVRAFELVIQRGKNKPAAAETA